jgi:hypothetical protein
MYGDQLRVKREFLGFAPVWHHGVELPGGQVAENGPFYGTRISDLASFAKGGVVEVVAHDMTMAQREAAVERARSRVGEHAYDALDWNCEHFATWCVTGAPVSSQLTEWVARLAEAALAAARPPAS